MEIHPSALRKQDLQISQEIEVTEYDTVTQGSEVVRRPVSA